MAPSHGVAPPYQQQKNIQPYSPTGVATVSATTPTTSVATASVTSTIHTGAATVVDGIESSACLSPPLTSIVHSVRSAAAAASGNADGDPDAPPSPTDEAGVLNRRPGKRPAARGTAFYPRKRANTACQVCRARKTKCDNKRPSCSYCLSVGATCIQSPVDLSSFDPASLKILDRLDDLERLFRQTSSAPRPCSGPSPFGLSSVGGSHFPIASLTTHGDREVSVDRNRDVMQRQLPHSLSHTLPPIMNSPGSNTSDHHRPHEYFVAGASSQPTFVDSGPEINSVLPERVDHILRWPILQASGYQHQSSFAYSRAPLDAIDTPSAGSASLAGLVDMESHRIYKLLDSFFLHIHCKNPILDEVSARRMILNAFLDGIDWSPASCLAMIVCALGCIATPFGPSSETKPGSQAYSDSQVFFHAAQKRIGILLVRSDIIGAQCLFLSGVYAMMVMQPVYSWRFFSQALAACQHFPFLTRAQTISAESQTSSDSIEMGHQDTQEQAVYWSAWKSERELRQELDLPDFNIPHSGNTLYPPFFPAPPIPPDDSPEGPDPETQRARASWLFYLAEISLRRLTSRLSSELLTLRKRYTSNSGFLDVISDMMPEYEAQVREWSDSLPAELSIHTPLEEDGICRSVLRGRMINLFEMVYWPFVMACIGAHSSRRPVKPVVRELAKRGLETHVHQIHANKPGFHHRHHGGMFMIRACTRSALVLVAAAKAGVVTPPNWHESVYQVSGMLAYWEDEDRELVRWRTTIERELAALRLP